MPAKASKRARSGASKFKRETLEGANDALRDVFIHDLLHDSLSLQAQAKRNLQDINCALESLRAQIQICSESIKGFAGRPVGINL